MPNKRPKFFVSIIYGYFHNLHFFQSEENYHLHALKIAKEMGYIPVAIIKGGEKEMSSDPNYDKDIKIIPYKNFFHFLYQVFKYAFLGSVFYVNSYEWQSFIVPFISRRAIFMAHTEPKRKNQTKQKVQDFVYKFFWKIRLNNEAEKSFLLERRINEKKLLVVPLVVSSEYFHNEKIAERKDLVYFGNVTAKKNLPTILKAFALVIKEKPEIKLNIIGKILDDNFYTALNELDLKNNVIIHGFTPLEELSHKLNQNLTYLNSSFDEGQCVAVYESALCGCALCLPNIMSFTGVYKDKALFHDVLDYKKLAENILFYLNNPLKAESDNEKCIEMIKNNYSKIAIEEKMKKLFNYEK